MPHQNPGVDDLRRILESAARIAVVGASSNPDRAAHGISRKLQKAGYQLVPVNPGEAEILGDAAHPSLAAVPGPVDVVVVFRKPDAAPDIAREAVAAGAKVLWLQTGVVSEEAAEIARAGGLEVVMDACIGATHSMLGIKPRPAAG
jgi:uncharacterized protein